MSNDAKLRNAAQDLVECFSSRTAREANVYAEWNALDLALQAILTPAQPEAERDALAAEVARLKAAIAPFIRHYDPSWMDDWADDLETSTFSIVTFGQLREARAALGSADNASR